MIRYNYELIRDEGNEKKTFKPGEIPTELDNLVYIEGPNSSGKSTLLNILALGFYGMKKGEEQLNPALKHKLENLVNAKYQQLKFDVEITSEDGKFRLVSEKPSLERPEIKVYQITNGKKDPLDWDRFQQDYNLIYDIPANPTDRLNQLALEIHDIQTRYGSSVGALKETLGKIIGDIRSTCDPKHLKKLKDDLVKLNKDQEILKKQIGLLQKEKELLEKATYCTYYTAYNQKVASGRKQKKELDTTVRLLYKTEKGFGSSNEVNRQNLDNQLGEMQKIFDEATELLKKTVPKSEVHHLKLWAGINLYQVTSELEFDEKLGGEIKTFKSILEKKKESNKNQKAFKEIELYQQLVNVLKNYVNLDWSLPGLGKPVSEFIEGLEKIIGEHEAIANVSENIRTLDGLLEQLGNKQEFIETTYLVKLRDLKGKSSKEAAQSREAEVKKAYSGYRAISERLEKDEEKLGFYEKNYAIAGRPLPQDICPLGAGELKKYSEEDYTEDQLINVIHKKNELLISQKAKFGNNEHEAKRLKDEIDNLEAKKPHKYQKHLGELDEIHEKVNSLEAKLRKQFTEYISAIIHKRTVKDPTNEQKQYNEVVFKYLGQRVDFLPYLSKYYKIDKIDLLEGIVTTKEGKKIRLEDMGTGQSQAAYLMGRLNTSDNRKIIALFDEVAMMDEKSLGPIYSKLRELYKANRLLAGVVVQKAESVRVISKVKEG